MDAVREHFRPELLNRIDEVVIFRPLGLEQITPIVDDPAWRAAQAAGRAQDHAGADAGGRGAAGPRGVRPGLRRSAVEADDPEGDRAAAGDARCLRGDFHDGDTIVVDAEGTALAFRRAEVAAPRRNLR